MAFENDRPVTRSFTSQPTRGGMADQLQGMVDSRVREAREEQEAEEEKSRHAPTTHLTREVRLLSLAPEDELAIGLETGEATA